MRHGVHRAHARVMHAAGAIDNAVRIGGRVYGALSPMIRALDDSHGTNIHSAATRAFNEYHHIARIASRAEGYRTRLTDDVRRAAPELGL